MRDRRRRPPIIRSIRTRLAVVFFLITLLAVAVIYVVVAPPLTSSLQNSKIDDLQRLAKPYVEARKQKLFFLHLTLGDNPGPLTKKHALEFAAAASQSTHLNSAVTIVDVTSIGTATQAPVPRVLVYYPSNAPTDAATLAAISAASQAAITPSVTGGFGLVGFPVRHEGQLTRVVVFSVPLSDVASSVSLVRSRILLAAAVALLVALLTGVLVARALTVRLLRLEDTAQRVAQGDFEAHFSDSSRDELGRLAQALAHMQSQLEGLDEARRRFIATASHELRTPIFSLGGFLELIQDEELDDETRRQFVGQVREQVDRLGKLATQLLDLSRLESGSVQLEPSPTDLGVLARAVSSEFVPALSAHDSPLEVRVPDEPVRAVCDPERVAQLLRILIDNALMHTASGTPVRVSVGPAPFNGGVRLAVHDQGPGIPADALDRIFEPFYSADGARGAGLGLAIAHELAVQMGARLEVISSAGDTTFTLILDGNADA